MSRFSAREGGCLYLRQDLDWYIERAFSDIKNQIEPSFYVGLKEGATMHVMRRSCMLEEMDCLSGDIGSKGDSS